MQKNTKVKEDLIAHFLTLNEFSGVNFIEENNNNVQLPNKFIEEPTDKTWFSLAFVFDEPESIGNFNTKQERYNGFMQIDIYTVIDTGEDEPNDIYLFLCKLFEEGSYIGDSIIRKIYQPYSTTEKKFYRTTVRIDFVADVDNEEI